MALYSTGSNSDGQLSNGTLDDSARWLRCIGLPPTGQPLSLAFGASHTLLLVTHTEPNPDPNLDRVRVRNELYVCGSNGRGQLGECSPLLGSLSAAPGPTSAFRKLHTAILTTAGDGDECSVWEPVTVACCWETSFVVLRPVLEVDAGASDVVVVMGADDWGERASATIPAPLTPRHISLSHLNPFASGDATLRILKLAAGPRHVVALLEWRQTSAVARKQVVGWGAARHRQLGRGPGVVERDGAGLRKVALATEIELPGEWSAEKVLDVAVGREHSLLVLAGPAEPGSDQRASHLLLLGTNKHHQLGSSNSRTDSHLLRLPLQAHLASDHFPADPLERCQAQCGWSGSFVLSTTTSSQQCLHAFGSNARSQLARPYSTCLSSAQPLSIELPPPPPGDERQMVRLAVGSEHVLLHCQIEGKDEVWAWGWNEHGNLGTGDQFDVEQPKMVWPGPESSEEERVVGVWAGNATSWIATEPPSPA